MKPEYKQTEIEVIPEDWDVESLKEAFPRLDMPYWRDVRKQLNDSTLDYLPDTL